MIDLVPGGIMHQGMECVVVAIALSDTTMGDRAEEIVLERKRTIIRPHRSVDVDSSIDQFLHVELIWPESIRSEPRLAVRGF